MSNDELLNMAERIDRFRAYLFGRGWVFGLVSGLLALCAAALRTLANQEPTNEQ